MVTFLAALQAIPVIISTFKALIGWLEDTFGPDWPQRILDLRAAQTQWAAAKTETERQDAIKAVAAAFNSHK